MTANWIMIIVGAWAIISPWLLQFSSITLAKWSSIIVGLIIVLTHLWAMFGNADEASLGASEEKMDVESEKGRNQKS